MNSVANKIMFRVRGYGRGQKAFTPKDFLDLGNRDGVDKALSRLAKDGKIRRIGRGIYDWPKHSVLLNKLMPPSIDHVIDVVCGRDGIRPLVDGFNAANGLGLTNAVPSKISYFTARSPKRLNVGSLAIEFKHTSSRNIAWADRPGAPVVQALRWLGQESVNDNPNIADHLRRILPDNVKKDLADGVNLVPGWMVPTIHAVARTENIPVP